MVTSYVLSLANWEIPDPNAISAEDAISQREAVENLKHALSQLPEKNRQLIEGYYFHDLTLAEIGSRLGLSKAWVCRLHAKSLEMLRELMAQSTAIGAGCKQP